MCSSNNIKNHEMLNSQLQQSPINQSTNTESVETSNYYCNYLNEVPPDSIPKIFAKGYISTSVDEYCFEINHLGNEIILDRKGVIYLAQFNGTTWSELEIASFSGKVVDGECCFSPSEEKIYFGSRRSLPGAKGDFNTWVAEKTDNIWQEPYPIKSPLWEQNTHAITVSSSGNIYQSGVNVFNKKNGDYMPQVQLSNNINGTHPFIAPDESYIIFCARDKGRWDKDLFISFKNQNSWSDPVLLNKYINTKEKESNPFVTPDGKYLFFTRSNDVYWVRFDFIDELKLLK